jgi:hypothetical protein
LINQLKKVNHQDSHQGHIHYMIAYFQMWMKLSTQPQKKGASIKLDYINPYSKGYTRRIEQDANNPLEIKTVAPGVGSCNEDMNQGAGWYSTGSYAYIIKPLAAKKLVEWIKINGFLPSDQQLGSYAADIKVCDPSIVQLHPYFSPENGLIKAMSMTMNTELLQ